MTDSFDLAIVGGGVIGLAHAYLAALRGKRVVVIERDTCANGASIRNFGFVTVTGQAHQSVWPLAKRARKIWAEIAPRAGIAIEHQGLLVTARYPESIAVLEAFLQTEMGEGCHLMTTDQLHAKHPDLAAPGALGALWSPHELRFESRLAIPTLTRWLIEKHGVTIMTGTSVHGVAPPVVETSRGPVHADSVIICPGDDFATLYPERIAAYAPTKCFLSMLRLADPGFRLPGGIMSDLGLVRYLGYAELPQAAALKARLAAEHADDLADGVHLIVVQSDDGSMVIGDSHHYGATPPPFAAASTETLILREFVAATGRTPPAVIERWTGIYSSCADRPYFIDTPQDRVRIVMVTCGAGASMSFGLAERTLNDLYGD
jgi:D-hydroxyproline dehydrogenase subunit beta